MESKGIIIAQKMNSAAYPNGYTAKLFIGRGNSPVIIIVSGNKDLLYYRIEKTGMDRFEINIPCPTGEETIYIINDKPEIKGLVLDKLQRKIVRYNFPKEVQRPFNLCDIHLQWVDNLKGTPARIYISGKNAGTIQISKKDFSRLGQPTRLFILLHELGHFWYTTENLADMFALYNFLNMGYNMTSAVYALTKVLRHNPQSVHRILKQIERIHQVKQYYE